jgi:hypothetical protein
MKAALLRRIEVLEQQVPDPQTAGKEHCAGVVARRVASPRIAV